MKHFTSTAIKDGRWWVVQCDQEPGALSQVARLDQAEDHQREAISMMTGVPKDEIEVVVVPELAPAVKASLELVRQRREEAERLQQEAAVTIEAVVRELVEQGQLSLRDTGFALGVSHQRVAQLLQAATEREARPIDEVLRWAQKQPAPLAGQGGSDGAVVIESRAGGKVVSVKSGGGRIAAKTGGGKVVSRKSGSAVSGRYAKGKGKAVTPPRPHGASKSD